jgi:hypothetical protein
LKLPVPPERLKAQFPSLDDGDLHAYAEVTQHLLTARQGKGKALSEVMAAAQRARESEAAGALPAAGDAQALRYLRALEKMQG